MNAVSLRSIPADPTPSRTGERAPIPTGLGYLLGSTSVAAFLARRWEREPLLVPAEDRAWESEPLVRSREIDDLVYFTRPVFPSFQEIDQGVADFQPSFVRGRSASRSVAEPAELGLDDLAAYFHGGRTLVVNDIDRRRPRVATLCREIAAELGHHVQANLYLTPPSAQGFPPHYDTHGVFILQLEGTKEWRLYDAPVLAPRGSPRTFDAADLGPPLPVRLEPGDVLYIPRGVVHEAFTAATLSLHLTIGIHTTDVVDLLKEALTALAADDPAFRQALPPGHLVDRRTLEAHFPELIRRFAARASLDRALDGTAGQLFRRSPPLPSGQIPKERADPSAITLDTLLERRPGLVCRLAGADDPNQLRLAWQTSEIVTPARVGPALRFVAGATGGFVARALPGLPEASRLVLARQLVTAGLLRVVP